MRRSLMNLLLLAATCSVAVGFPVIPASPAPAIVPEVPVQPGEVTTPNSSNNTSTTTPSNDPTTTAVPSTTSSTLAPTTTSTTTPSTTTKTTPTTTVKPTTTTASPNPTPTPPPSPAPSPSPSPETTVAPGPVTTNVPPTPAPSKGRHFDGLSFMGGIILTACLVGLSVGSYKFYKIKTERSYRTL